MICCFCLSRIEDALIFELEYPVDEEMDGSRWAVIPKGGLRLPYREQCPS